MTRGTRGPPSGLPTPTPGRDGKVTALVSLEMRTSTRVGRGRRGRFGFSRTDTQGWKAPPEQLGQAPGQGGQLSFLPAAIWPLSE